MELNVTNENFAELKNSDLPLVVDFSATWRKHNSKKAPIVEELTKEYEGRVNVAKCDIEECEDIAAELGIRNIPTLLFIKGGQVVDKLVGAQSKTKLQEKIENLL